MVSKSMAEMCYSHLEGRHDINRLLNPCYQRLFTRPRYKLIRRRLILIQSDMEAVGSFQHILQRLCRPATTSDLLPQVITLC